MEIKYTKFEGLALIVQWAVLEKVRNEVVRDFGVFNIDVLFVFQDYDFTSASGVYSYLNSGPKKIMLLGPADNDIAKAIAHHAGLPSYGVLQVKVIMYEDDLSRKAWNNAIFLYFFS